MIQVIPLMHKIVDVIRGLTEFFGKWIPNLRKSVNSMELKKKTRFENLFNTKVEFMLETCGCSNNNLMTIILRIIN